MTPSPILPHTRPPQHAPTPRCAHHSAQHAIAQCTCCGEPICHLCHGSDLRGFARCRACHKDADPPAPLWEDELSPSAPESFALTAFQALTSPSKFWEPVRHNARWLPALAFGMTCIIFGDTLFTCWELLLNPRLEGLLRENMLDANAAKMPSAVLRAMSLVRVLLFAPFVFLIRSALLRSALRFAGVQADFATAARIFGYSCAGYLWMLLPPIWEIPVGHMLMIFWMFNIQTAGVRHFYRNLSPVASLLVVMVPLLVALGIQCV